MSFQQIIDKAEYYLQIKSFDRAIQLLKDSSPDSLWERNKLRDIYFKGGELAYAAKELADAISFFEEAKIHSHSPTEIAEVDKRIYFTLFLHFQREGKSLLAKGDKKMGLQLLRNANSSYERYPKDPQIKDKARDFMQVQVLQIRKILYEEGEDSVSGLPEESKSSSASGTEPVHVLESSSYGENLEERVAFKLAISSGLELFRENCFGLALEEFEKALKLRQTDQLVSIIAKCKLGISLVEELDKCYGKTA